MTVAFDVTTTDWKLLTENAKSIDEIARKTILSDVDDEVNKHARFFEGTYNHDLAKFWKQVYACLSSADNKDNVTQ